MGSFNAFSAHGPTVSPLVARDRPGSYAVSGCTLFFVDLWLRQGTARREAAAAAARRPSPPAQLLRPSALILVRAE